MFFSVSPPAKCARKQAAGVVDDALTVGKVEQAGLEAARKKFTPEFMNRIDKTVVFHPLCADDLRKILTIELNMVQQRSLQRGQRGAFCLPTHRKRERPPAARGYLT